MRYARHRNKHKNIVYKWVWNKKYSFPILIKKKKSGILLETSQNGVCRSRSWWRKQDNTCLNLYTGRVAKYLNPECKSNHLLEHCNSRIYMHWIANIPTTSWILSFAFCVRVLMLIIATLWLIPELTDQNVVRPKIQTYNVNSKCFFLKWNFVINTLLI